MKPPSQLSKRGFLIDADVASPRLSALLRELPHGLMFSNERSSIGEGTSAAAAAAAFSPNTRSQEIIDIINQALAIVSECHPGLHDEDRVAGAVDGGHVENDNHDDHDDVPPNNDGESSATMVPSTAESFCLEGSDQEDAPAGEGEPSPKP